MHKRANGEGTICQRADGFWLGKIMVGYKPNGEPNIIQIVRKTQKEVRDELHALISDGNAGTIIENKKMLLNDWLDIWFKTYQAGNKNSSKETELGRINHRIKPYFVKKKLTSITPEMIQWFYNDLQNGDKPLSAASVHRIHHTLNKALKQAYKNRLIKFNPCEMVTLPKEEQRELIIFTPEEQNAFLKAIKGHRLELAFHLAIHTGLRRGELLGLKWEDVDFNAKTLSIKRTLYYRQRVEDGKMLKSKFYFDTPKNKTSIRVIPLTDQLIRELRTQKTSQSKQKLLVGAGYVNNGMVFCNELGDYVSPDTLSRQYAKLLKDNNIRHVKFHGLRHAFATRALEAGANMKVVQTMLGHAKLETTANIYSHVSLDEQKKVMDLLDKIM